MAHRELASKLAVQPDKQSILFFFRTCVPRSTQIDITRLSSDLKAATITRLEKALLK